MLTPKLWAPLNPAHRDASFGTLQSPIRSLLICFWGGGTIHDGGGMEWNGTQNTILRLDYIDINAHIVNLKLF